MRITIGTDAQDIRTLGEKLKDVLPESVTDNLATIVETVAAVKSVNVKVLFDPTLVRGMGYYTGPIFEIRAEGFSGSVGGGGRYDNLTGIFGLPGISGVGISFGADRIYDVLGGLDLYPKEAAQGTELLFINFGATETAYCLPVLRRCREAGIRTEIYPDSVKMKKQMAYANSKNIPFVVLAGESEIADNKFTLKNMTTGEQKLVIADELVEAVK